MYEADNKVVPWKSDSWNVILTVFLYGFTNKYKGGVGLHVLWKFCIQIVNILIISYFSTLAEFIEVLIPVHSWNDWFQNILTLIFME